MKRPLLTLLISTSAMVAMTSASFAGDCPLHKRLAAQDAQQSKVTSPAVVSTASLNVAPQEFTPTVFSAPATITPVAITAPTVAPAPRLASVAAVQPSAVRPSVTQQFSPSTPTVDYPVTQEAQSNYGSGTAAPRVKDAMVKKTGVHADFTNILQKYVSAPDGQGLTHFNYGRLKATPSDKAALDTYINKLEGINPDRLGRNEAIAYYANLYNAVTVQVITDNYPLKSIRKLGPFNSGPWKKDLFTINGVPSNLNAVEHEILRKKFPSPYVHYMVNCASVGCPNLLQSAWEADSLERLRVQAARDYINSPRGVQITPKGLKVSSIFKWFKEDFGGSEQNIVRHIREHANPALAAAIDNGARIDGYDYDWSVND